MGAKQSKRSVDISGKEAEGAGEVAAAGAGGEGRVEQLADADALKPQLNGDAHIHETSDKEKQLDSGTPENEKDAVTEKEGKTAEEAKEKESPAVTNGESEPKEENGETVATPEDAKKPKKEKVKKKWSLRSISFSRKDKPKQDKKAKEDEAKTPNGESEKLPEEIAENTPENAVNEVAEEVKSDTDTKEEKAPETPVTEPITNGSNTPESPKTESSPTVEPIPETPEDNDRPEPKAALPEPEQLPVNGLSLEEPKVETPEVTKSEEINTEKTLSVTSESVPAPEIAVTKEVCVEQMPKIEPSPPPLPANPPPSSVASFAATTMAPELTDASLATSTDINTTTSPIAITDTNRDVVDKDTLESNHDQVDVEKTLNDVPSTIKDAEVEIAALSASNELKPEKSIIPTITYNGSDNETDMVSDFKNDESVSSASVIHSEVIVPDNVEIPEILTNESHSHQGMSSPTILEENSMQNHDNTDAVTDKESISDKKEMIVNDYHLQNEEFNDDSVIDVENLKNTAKNSHEIVKENECNGKMEDEKSETEDVPPPVNMVEDVILEAGKATTPDDSMPPSLSEAMESQAFEVSNDASESFPLPPSELCRSEEASPPNSLPPAVASPQDALPVVDKIADLIPEVPVVPELKTDMETTSDVALAN
ncbi:unnamed protein product [Parnassius mnemosyne]|uniref:A-kinase anchor protein 200 n=1 Tax=Parnassius mnemosyne TaxID=213953 RepID=A0AAV1M0C5_9NEOP